MKGAQLPAPQNPVTLDRDGRMRLMGEDGTFQVLEAPQRLPVGGQYEVTSMVPALRGADALTINQLLAGGRHYDEWLEPLAKVTPQIAGQDTIDAADAIVKALPAKERAIG